jgi:hypothetical protein
MNDADPRPAAQRKRRSRKKEDDAWYRTRRAMLAVSPTPVDKFAVYVDRAANAAACVGPNIGYVSAVVERLAGVLSTRHARIDRQRWLVELEEVVSALDDAGRGSSLLREEINALRDLHASFPRSATSLRKRVDGRGSGTAQASGARKRSSGKF